MMNPYMFCYKCIIIFAHISTEFRIFRKLCVGLVIGLFKGESPQCLCAYILTQRHLFPAMIIMTSIAVTVKRLRRFRRHYGVAPE